MLKILPGMARLDAAALEAAGQTALMIARARARGRPRAITVPLPIEDPNAQLLAGELERRLGERWRGDDRELRALKKELGAAYPLWYLPVGLVFVLVVAALTLLGAAGWGFLTGGDDGRSAIADARWWAFAGLAAWLGLCALLFVAARRSLGGDHAWRYAVPIPFLLLIAVLTPTAVGTFTLVEDRRFSDLEPAPLVALAVWVGLVLVAVRFVRRLRDREATPSE